MAQLRYNAVAGVEGDPAAEIRINFAEIPKFRRDEFSEHILMLAQEHFKQPGVEERYQAWLKEEKRRLCDRGAANG